MPVYEVLLYALLNKPPGVLTQSVGAQASWIRGCLEQHGYWIAPQALTPEQEEVILQGLGMPIASAAPPGRETITTFLAGYMSLMFNEHPDLILLEEVSTLDRGENDAPADEQ
jgi:hypothetical protein